MSKPFSEMDKTDRKMCKEKIKWLATIGFRELPDQATPRIIHPDLPGEIFDVYDLNQLAMVMRIFNLGEEIVNKIIKPTKKHSTDKC